MRDSYIFIFLIFIATISYSMIFLFRKSLSASRYLNLCQRIKTWYLIIGMLYLGSRNKILIVFLFIFISYLAMIEFLELFDLKLDLVKKTSIILVIAIHYFFLYKNILYAFYFFIPTLIVIIFIFLKKRNEVSLGLISTVYLISYLPYLINTKIGITGIIVYIILVELNDIYQYISGTIFGKIKIVPKTSPNKTLEGILGGIFLLTITIFVLNKSFDYKINIWLGIVIGIVGFLGDIYISYFKRKNNKKDSGRILSGHGGILDRIDSLIFTSPLIMVTIVFFGNQ